MVQPRPNPISCFPGHPTLFSFPSPEAIPYQFEASLKTGKRSREFLVRIRQGDRPSLQITPRTQMTGPMVLGEKRETGTGDPGRR